MRHLTALGTLALMLLGLALAQGYYPHGDGLSWTYDNGVTQILSGPREFAGSEVMVMTQYLQGVPISETYLAYEPGGVLSYGTAAGGDTQVYRPALVLYEGLELTPGQSWQSVSEVGNVEIVLSSQVIGTEGVQTPAGRYNTLQIRQVTDIGGSRTTTDLYFVPTVGVVRFVTEDGTVVDLIEKSF